MRNLGIALGAAAPSALSTFRQGLGAMRELDEYSSEAELREAMRRAPRVGEQMPDPQAEQRVGAERTRLGLPAQADVAAINAARQARGESADFAPPAGRVATAADRQRAVTEALENTSSPRNIALASQLRLQASQLETAEMERNRRGFADAALRANALVRSGDHQGALRIMEMGYNRYFPDGRTASLSMDGDHVVARMAGSGSDQPPLMRFGNIREAAEAMLNFSTPEAFQAMMQRQLVADEGRLNRASHERIAGGNNATTLAAARMQIAAADARHTQDLALQRERLDLSAAEAQRQGMYVGAQMEHLSAQTADLRERVRGREESRTGLDEFMSTLQANPNDPRLTAMATRLYTRDPEGFRGQRTVTMPDGSVGREPVNTLEVILRDTQQRLGAAATNIRQQLGNTPTPADIAAARTAFDRQWGDGAFERQFGSTYSGAPTAPAAPTGRGLRTAPQPAAPQSDQWGRPIPAAPEVPYSTYQPQPQRPTSQGSHPAPGASQPAPPAGTSVSRSALEEWLRNNPPPAAR